MSRRLLLGALRGGAMRESMGRQGRSAAAERAPVMRIRGSVPWSGTAEPGVRPGGLQPRTAGDRGEAGVRPPEERG